jgi:hypothetical protein
MAKNRNTTATTKGAANFQEDPKGPQASQVTGRKTVDAASDAEAEAGAKKGYETMIVGVSKANKEKRDKLDALAAKLGCKPSALIWAAVDALLAAPPTVAPAGAAPSTGTAAGFWVVPIRDKSGKASTAKVVEVASRSDITNGSTFFRFKAGDDKERNRAKAQAIRGAKYTMDLLGAKGEPTVEEIA